LIFKYLEIYKTILFLAKYYFEMNKNAWWRVTHQILIHVVIVSFTMEFVIVHGFEIVHVFCLEHYSFEIVHVSSLQHYSFEIVHVFSLEHNRHKIVKWKVV
jgi:hypothetical protein